MTECTCPRCRLTFPLREAQDDQAWRDLVDAIHALPPVVHRPLWDYLALFTPEKQKLRVARMLGIVQEIAPMIRAAQITRARIAYVVSPETWANALRYLVDTPPATLQLPLKGNGYLLEILAKRAEKATAQAETQQEEQRRHAPEGARTGAPVAVREALKKGPPPGWKHEAFRRKGEK